MSLPRNPDYFLGKLHELHVRVRDRIVRRLAEASVEALSAVASDDEGDTIFAIDTDSEDVLVAFCREWAGELPLVLIAEGLGRALCCGYVFVIKQPNQRLNSTGFA